MRSAVSGRLIAGRYRLGSVVGHGGMGVVWQSRDELLSRDVAVKELTWPPDYTEQEQRTACRRTIREAQTAAKLNHPNIIRVYRHRRRRRPPVDRHGTPPVPVAPRPRAGGRAAYPGPGGPRRPGHPRRAARRARRGHRAPGRDAGQRPGRPGRAGGAHRFRHRPCRRQPDAHQRRHAGRVSVLHRPRARQGRAVRRAGRPLGARGLALRRGRGTSAVRTATRPGDPHRHRRRRAGAGQSRGPVVAADQRPAPQGAGGSPGRGRD